MDSYIHQKKVHLTIGYADQASALVIHGLDSPQKGSQDHKLIVGQSGVMGD